MFKTLKLWSKEISNSTTSDDINDTLAAIAAPKWYTTIFATSVVDNTIDSKLVANDIAALPQGVDTVSYVVIPVANDFVNSIQELVNCARIIKISTGSIVGGTINVELPAGDYYFIKVSTLEMNDDLTYDSDFAHGYVIVPVTQEMLDCGDDSREKWAEIGVKGTGWYRIGIFKDGDEVKHIRTVCLVSMKDFHGKFNGLDQPIGGEGSESGNDDEDTITGELDHEGDNEP